MHICKDVSDGDWMDNVGVATLPFLAFVAFVGELIRPQDFFYLGGFQVGGELVFEVFNSR
jgi:hypothetical protein